MAGRYEQEKTIIEEVRQDYLTLGEEGFWKKKLEIDLKNLSKGQGSSYNIASDYSNLRENDYAFSWLDRSIKARELDLDILKVDPKMEPLHSDPRFKDFLRRVNLE
jgi:hypothetical protein